MLTRVEYRLRRRLQGFATRVGTPPVAFALLLLAAVFVATPAVWAETGSRDAAAELVSSLAFTGLAVALFADALVSMLRGVPTRSTAAGVPSLRLPTRGEAAGLLFRAAYLAAGAAFVGTVGARDVTTLRVAEGELATGAVEQIVDREPPRRYSAGPSPLALTVERVTGVLSPDGTVKDLRVAVRSEGGSRTILSRWRPLWSGWGEVVLTSRSGIALRYEVGNEGRTVLETAFAKLALLPVGRREEVRCQTTPHRFLFSIVGDGTPDGSPPALDVEIYRSRLKVGGGRLGAGGVVGFEGLTLSVPEARRWVELRLIRDPGIVAGCIAAALALGGVVLNASGRRRSRMDASQGT